jgi:hypothetical protein
MSCVPHLQRHLLWLLKDLHDNLFLMEQACRGLWENEELSQISLHDFVISLTDEETYNICQTNEREWVREVVKRLWTIGSATLCN